MATVTSVDVSRITTQEAYQEHLKRLKGEIEKRNKKTVEQLYQEKQKRLWDAMTMKVPDRVPVILGGTFFACKYGGLPYSSVYYDPIRWKAAYAQMMADYEPDTWGTAGGQSGTALDIIQAKNILWPGGTLPPDVPQQNVDGEYMKEDEYDLFLEDFTDFYVRRYLPRVYGALEPLAKLPAIGGGLGSGIQGIAAIFDNPELAKVAQTMRKYNEAQAKFRQAAGNHTANMAVLGLPPTSEGPAVGGGGGPGVGSGVDGGAAAHGGGGPGGPAFDQLANTYRGWKGIVTDMYRRPEKLIAAMEKITRGPLARMTPADPNRKGPQFSGGGAIHRGSDRFLSKKQWETFYWPTWKRGMLKAIELGYRVNIFAEGFCEERFEYFLELPKGKVMIRFTDTNMFKAKEVLGDHCALMGSVPLTLLQMGSPSEVDEFCKKMIMVCGKGGGYILRADTDFIQEAKPANVKAMVDSVKKYRP